MLKKLITIGAILQLTACMSNYVQPSMQQSTATIQAVNKRANLLIEDASFIDAIDDKNVNNIFSNTAKMRILPGKHELTVRAEFIRSLLSNESYFNTFQIPVNVKPGQQYYVKSSHHGNKINMWVENQNHKKITAVHTKEALMQRTQVVPVVITN